MGRMLGYFDNGDELDRPDLNKCPDCGCFFAQENCPVCGKPCPEEMRAGNRRPVKAKKGRHSSGSGRVTFVAWYHSWWFMILMLFIFPLCSLVLFATSPYKRKTKIIAAVLIILFIFVYYFVGVGTIISWIKGLWDKPVDTSMTREEYISVCRDVTSDKFYRSAEDLKGEFVSVTLSIVEKITDMKGYYNGEKYVSYYICSVDGAGYEIMVRDCIQDNEQNFIAGDIVTFYGEGAGNVTVYDMNGKTYILPCLNAAYTSYSP